MERNGAHDNTNIRVSNSFNGSIVVVGGVYVGGLGAIFLALFMANFWAQAIVLSAVLIWGAVIVLGLAVLTGAVVIWVRFVVHPLKNKILHKQDNAIVIINSLGNVEVVPLIVGIKPTIVEADPTSELTIMDLHKHEVPQQLIADGMGISQSTVSRVIKKHKAEK